jgi:hypothetical protein
MNANIPFWCYLLTFDESASSHECMKRFIEDHDAILDWHSPMARSFILVAQKASSSLNKIIREHTKDKGHFIIVDLATDRNGWLAKASWDFINQYCSKPKV